MKVMTNIIGNIEKKIQLTSSTFSFTSIIFTLNHEDSSLCWNRYAMSNQQLLTHNVCLSCVLYTNRLSIFNLLPHYYSPPSHFLHGNSNYLVFPQHPNHLRSYFTECGAHVRRKMNKSNKPLFLNS